jgi:hypothetical protein
VAELTALQAATQLATLIKKLDERAARYRLLDGYLDASQSPIPR